ncbi:glycosyltransferase [Dyadobacter sp. CY343]|uniref:glycosyltransferase family 2 protein n=1 Tax=Dyadobacter sp. CY343 TaxID=2907299 RepID=UPI001F30A4C0|nr:glycosyltransferase [Dyadobacter sp. CY343]MCE7059785.1 glycosyltransferase [Dyadobacter sp. CY343]
MPALSIIVPVYNKEQYVESSLNSILNQSFTDFEVIVVNDGSTDSSPARCDAFARRDPRITVVHQNNQGVSEARNAGVKLATGRYIGFVDCDDELEKDMYEILLTNISDFKADISMCGVKKTTLNNQTSDSTAQELQLFNKKEALVALLNNDFPISVYDKIYRADLAKSVLFTGHIYEDMFYNFNVLQKASKVIRTSSEKYNYIVRENSESMARFSKKYMNILDFSTKMLAQSRNADREILESAVMFDFVTNISLLNLLILSDASEYAAEYKLISDNLSKYRDYPKNATVRSKHKYALSIFLFQPVVYKYLLRLYCQFADSDVLRRTK